MTQNKVDRLYETKCYGLSTIKHWDDHNKQVLKGDIIGTTNENTAITKNCIVKVNNTSCSDFKETTEQLNQRARHINYWKTELERAIKEIDEEINVLEKLRQQVKNAEDTLKIPEYINNECLELRCNRMESDLIHDDFQEALFEESKLIENVKNLQRNMVRDIEKQLEVNFHAKEALENDWSLKYSSYKLENENIDLKTKSVNVKHSAGATKLTDGQSNVEAWEQNTIAVLSQFKKAFDASKELRELIEATLNNTTRDLRTVDIKVLNLLNKRVAQTDKVKVELENQLKLTLEKIVETENELETLHDEIIKVSQRIQVAQTRLSIKSCRPNIENCRDGSLFSLFDEVRDLNDSKSLLEQRVIRTNEVRADLIHERGKLENELIVKKKSLHIDKERCLFLRSHYQSAEKLCGY